jgi:gamma-glutamyltranspeptidase/glutathione hydrolase/leukotriene-C4 hydrolase
MHELQSKEYANIIRQKIEDNRTYSDPQHYGAVYYSADDHGTAHLSVLAPNGDAASITSTVNL